MTAQDQPLDLDNILPLLICPRSGEALHVAAGCLENSSGTSRYRVSQTGIPLFAEEFLSPEAAIQQEHYDQVAEAYAANLEYPHTQEYMEYLDRVLREEIGATDLATCAEVCCGTGGAFALFHAGIGKGVGVDISESMLAKAKDAFRDKQLSFVQGDATLLPLAEGAFDSVIMLGGIHHVPDREALFQQVFRVLKPGGVFYFREPVSDFWLWKFLRATNYMSLGFLPFKT